LGRNNLTDKADCENGLFFNKTGAEKHNAIRRPQYDTKRSKKLLFGLLASMF